MKIITSWLKQFGSRSSRRAIENACRLESLEERRLMALTVTDSLNDQADSLLDFPNTIVSQVSDEQTMVIGNSGPDAIDVTKFGLSGDVADFRYELRDPNGALVTGNAFTVNPGDEYVMTVQFDPTMLGDRAVVVGFEIPNPALALPDPPPDLPETIPQELNITGKATPVELPARPTGLTATPISDSQIDLAWTDNADNETSYKVYMATSANGVYKLVEKIDADSTSFSVGGLSSYKKYYFRVAAHNALGNSYYATANARTLAPTEDPSNNTLDTAKDLGSLEIAARLRDFVGTADTVDFYKMNLAVNGGLRFDFKNVTNTIKAQLFRVNPDNSWTVMASKTSAGSFLLYRKSLPAGDYYLRVSKASADTAYDLTAAADYAGYQSADIRNIGTLNSTVRTFNDSISVSDRVDVYRFTVSGDRLVRMTLSGLSLDADVFLLDSNGVQVVATRNPGTADEYLSQHITAGTYYLKINVVYPNGSSGYKLQLSAS